MTYLDFKNVTITISKDITKKAMTISTIKITTLTTITHRKMPENLT
jgi:hypothetical protein